MSSISTKMAPNGHIVLLTLAFEETWVFSDLSRLVFTCNQNYITTT